MTFFARHGNTYSFLLVVADVEGEGDDLRGDFGREAREALRSPRHEGLPVGLLVRREAAGCDLAQVGVGSVGRDRGASGQQDRVYAALLRPVNSAPQRGKVLVVTDVDIRSGSSRE